MALCGDLADVVNLVPIDVQAVVLGQYLTALSGNAIVLVASGKHDLDDLDGPGEHGEQVAGTADWFGVFDREIVQLG